MDGPILGTPALAEDGTIFVANGRNFSAVSADGKILSQVIIGTGEQASLTLALDGTVYVATYETKLIAYTGGHGGLMNSPWPKYQADLANTGAAPLLLTTLIRFGPRFLYISLGFFIVLSWAYFAGLESSSWRATLGKRVLGLYVADTRGHRIAFARATGRFLGGRFLAHVPPFGPYYFLIDCICAGFTPRNQALHDIFASCLVLRDPSTGGLTPIKPAR